MYFSSLWRPPLGVLIFDLFLLIVPSGGFARPKGYHDWDSPRNDMGIAV